MNTTIKRLACLLIALVASVAVHATDWLPVTPEDLQLKSEPKAPAAPAIYLYRQVDRDDNTPDEIIYNRIKILTEEGRKYGNIEIPYTNREAIRSIDARTIRPDGTVIEFDGKIYDKEIMKARGVRVVAKSFQLPNVEIGSILEYRYRHSLRSGYVFNSSWILSQELFTRRAKFSLLPSKDFTLRWSWPIGLPEGTELPKKVASGHVRLDTLNVPAFVVEELMPPEDAMKYRVEFIYDDTSVPTDPAKFWKSYGKSRSRTVESFANDRRAMEQAVAQIVQPQDSPEEKVRKIYRRAQQVRNLSFERSRTEEEEKREHLDEGGDAEAVWKRGYGDGTQITWLFMALVRAAGFEANPVLIPTRDEYFFDQRLLNPWQLNSNAVVVKLGAQDLYLDPGTPFTPYGMLPWSATGVNALRLDKSGGSFISTPQSEPASSRIERKATLHLKSGTSLEGKVTVTYTGMEAYWRRMSERNEDEAARRKFLESEIEGDIPTGIDVKLTNTPDWKGSDAPLVAEYDLTVPGWASSAGKRVLMPVGLFSQNEKHAFEHAARVHPLHIQFPYQHTDDVTIELPAGWQASSIPQPRTSDLKFALYSTKTEEAKGTLHLQRDLMLNFMFAQVKFYPTFHTFFQTVRAGDEDQIVVMPGAAVAKQ